MRKLFLLGMFLFSNFLYCNVALGLVENNTEDGYYKYFGQGSDQLGAFFVSPLTNKTALDFTDTSTKNIIILPDIKGNNPNINLKIGHGVSSGQCTIEDQLPSYLELWTGSPTEDMANRAYIRFCLKGDNGYFGLRVKADGSPRLFPIADIEFLDTEFVEDQEEIAKLDEKLLGKNEGED